jgi:transcription elongation factor GreB
MKPPKPKKPAGPQTPNYMTPAGFRRMCDELIRMRTIERPEQTRKVAAAAAHGDRSDNAEYQYGKRKLREMDKRMRFLEQRVDDAQVVEIKPRPGKEDVVFFGATVTLEDEDGDQVVYQLVGVDEIDLKAGKISWKSPIGGALLGKAVDAEVKVTTPAGTRTFTIVEVEYK